MKDYCLYCNSPRNNHHDTCPNSPKWVGENEDAYLVRKWKNVVSQKWKDLVSNAFEEKVFIEGCRASFGRHNIISVELVLGNQSSASSIRILRNGSDATLDEVFPSGSFSDEDFIKLQEFIDDELSSREQQIAKQVRDRSRRGDLWKRGVKFTLAEWEVLKKGEKA